MESIPPLLLKESIECHRSDGLPTLTSNKMEYPECMDDQLICRFDAKEDQRYYFTKRMEEIMTTEERIQEIITYINKYTPYITSELYSFIHSFITGMKIKPQSEFMIGDYCRYKHTNTNNPSLSFVQIQAIHTNQSMFEAQAVHFPVNQIKHLDMDPCEHRLIANKNGYRSGAVSNQKLVLLHRGSTNKKFIKQHCLALIFQSLHQESLAKYQNEKKLKKIVFKNKIKKMKDELKRIVVEGHVGQKKKIRIPCINKREFNMIFKPQMKEQYGYIHWKETKASITLKLSTTAMARIFGGATIKQTQGYKYSVEGAELKWMQSDKEMILWVHITSLCFESKVVKGDVASKKKRYKAKAKRKRDEKKQAIDI
eukprot:218341_1